MNATWLLISHVSIISCYLYINIYIEIDLYATYEQTRPNLYDSTPVTCS